MRSVVYASFGNPADVLELGERPTPEPAPGQVRVKMHCAAIHNHDLWMIKGSYGQRPALPAIAGSEAAGVVEAVGEGVTHLRVGDRVAGFAHGAWSESFVASAAGLVSLPASMTDDIGCQLVAMPLSAMALLDAYAPPAPDLIVQNAANGAVGRTLAKLAQARGIGVVSLVRSEDGVRELAEHGVSGAISTASPDWRERVDAVRGSARIVAAIDSIGGRASGDLCALLSPGGRFVSFGSLTGEPMQLDPAAFIFKQLRLEGFWLSRQNAIPHERSRVLLAEIMKLTGDGVLRFPVAGRYPLARVREAVVASVCAGRRGKVLLEA